MNPFQAGIKVLRFRQRAVIDNADDYTLPVGEGGRAGSSEVGREENKGHNDVNDDHRIINT